MAGLEQTKGMPAGKATDDPERGVVAIGPVKAPSRKAVTPLLSVPPGQLAAPDMDLLVRLLIEQDRKQQACEWVEALANEAPDRAANLLRMPLLRRLVVDAEKRISRVIRNKIKAMLHLGQLGEARRLIAQVPADWQNTARFQQMNARILLGEGKLDEAALVCRQMLDASPSNAAIAAILVEVLRQQERFAAARDLFVATVWTGDVPLARKFRQLSGLASVGSAAEIGRFLERIDTAPAEMGQKLAAIESAVGLPHRALARLLACPPAELTASNKDLLIRTMIEVGRPADALFRLKQVLAEEPETPARLAQLSELQLSFGDVESAFAVLETAASRWPDSWHVLQQMWLRTYPRDRLGLAFAGIEATWKSMALDGLALWNLAMTALQLQRTETACEALEEIARSGLNAHASELLAILKSRPLRSWKEECRLDGSASRTIDYVRVPQAKATLIVFPAIDGRCNYLPFEYLDVFLADHPVNVVYVRDPEHRVITDGLLSFEGERQSILLELRQLARELDASRLITFGASAGGFTAIRAAILLNAFGAITFSAPTKFFAATDAPSFAKRRLSAMHAMSAYTADERDVLPDVSAHPELRIWQFPGALHREDMWQATRLSGFPHVATMPCKEISGHATLLHVMRTGQFPDIISRSCL